ncbi:hypothetical protein SNEBB_004155 [Seison nebaliae]|nr:hypothetical protein SNEBB_004155 [Seison nebaliae]
MPLTTAVRNSDEEMVQFLLNLKADPNCGDKNGFTSLMSAAEIGHVNSLELLCKAPADPNILNKHSETALFYTLSLTHRINDDDRHLKCAELLIEYGGNVNCVNSDGISLFNVACGLAKENASIILLLLNKGANVHNINPKTKKTSLHLACVNGPADVVNGILLKGGDKEAKDVRNYRPLHDAVKNGNFEAVKVLASHRVEFDIYDKKGNTPLHLACTILTQKETEKNKVLGHLIRFVAQRGCNPKRKNYVGDVAKILAKETGNKEVSKNIKKADGMYNKMHNSNQEWKIELYDYTFSHHDRLIEQFEKFDDEKCGKVSLTDFETVLTKEGFDEIPKDDLKRLMQLHQKHRDDGIDYHMFLCGKKYLPKAYLMVAFEEKSKKKKKKKAKTKKGKLNIPFPICIDDEGERLSNGRPPAIYAPKYVPFSDNERFSGENIVSNVIHDDSIWYLNHPDKRNINLCDAAYCGDRATIAAAVARGWPVDIHDKLYKTPLMAAAAQGDLETCKLLISLGASVKTKDQFDWTPLHHAAHTGYVNSKSLCGGTPLSRAIEGSNRFVVEYLIKNGAKLRSIETKRGNDIESIAKEYANMEIIKLVKDTLESLPPIKNPPVKTDKKAAANTAADKGNKKEEDDKNENRLVPPTLPPLGIRRSSLLRSTNWLVSNSHDGLDYSHQKKVNVTWFPQPNSAAGVPGGSEHMRKVLQKLTIEEKKLQQNDMRKRFGWHVDFRDLPHKSYNKNIQNHLNEI